MTDRIDHAARSRRRMEETLSSYETGEDAGAIVVALAALNDATLALVEQQRLANEQMRRWTMTDRLTDADLDAIGQRLTEGRIVNVVAQRALFAEVCRLRAMETRVTMLAASWHYAWPGQRVDLSKSEQLRAALDGGE